MLDADHPDVLDFVRAKAREEQRARTLIAAGHDAQEVVRALPFQQSSHSVRVDDAFMIAASEGGDWSLRAVTTGEVVDTLPARELLRECAQAAWECGDPGLLLASAIDAWHTCPASGPITASNPCPESLHVDDSACNLATLNLLQFLSGTGAFDMEGFVHAVETMLLAQDVLVDGSGYPTKATEEGARSFRQLGLGFANPRCPAAHARPGLRLRRGPRLGGRRRRPDDRRRLPALGRARRALRRLPRLRANQDQRRGSRRAAARPPRRTRAGQCGAAVAGNGIDLPVRRRRQRGD